MADGVTIRGRLRLSLLPKTTALFRDYLYRHEEVADLYPADPRGLTRELDPDRLLSGRDFSRRKLVDILKGQNRRWGCSERTQAHLELLARPDSLVVVTGQQVGLFTGPLFTIYKALTVLQLARQLGERFGHRFVPLFWMACDDHDYAEANHIVVLDEANRPLKLQHSGDHHHGLPVGSLPLGQGVEPLLAHLQELLPDTEFKARVLELFGSAYRPVATFSSAFGQTMLELFAEDGLVLVDPTDSDLRHLAIPVFRKELEEAPRTAELVARRGDQLVARGYHAQLQVDPAGVNLFLSVNGRRWALFQDEGGFGLKRRQKRYSRRELLDLLEASPERFSPNAALRPLLQDALFPVAAYVAGPAELAYFAQLGPLYELFGVPRPPVYPRVSLTLMEGRVGDLLEKFGLELQDVFVERDRLFGRVTTSQLPEDLAETITAALGQIQETFRGLSHKIIAFEPTMEGYLASSAGKVDHHLMAVRRKLLQAHRSRDKILREQVSKVSNHLYPSGQLQERLLNVIPFLARHGLGLLQELRSLSAEPWEHLAVEL